MAAVEIQHHGAVACVRMNLEHKRNVLTEELYLGLAAALDDLQNDVDRRAIVLSGGRYFCAGGDLSGLDAPALEFRRAMLAGQGIVRSLTGGRLPVVAAVEGDAYGAGFAMALACDFVVGDANSKFCASFGRFGLVPDYGMLWTLPQRVGVASARRLLMLGDLVQGQEAFELGLIDRLAEPGAVLDTAIALAQSLAQTAPATIATAKAVLARAPLSLDATLAWEADTQALLVRSEDFTEGVQAFRGKRAAAFRDR